MASFDWVNTPPRGTCITCGTSANDRGFVNAHADVMLDTPLDSTGFPQDVTFGGVADVVFCADCLIQMASLVGCASFEEVEKFALKEYELTEELERTKDEASAWSQRFDNLLSDSFSENVKAIIEEQKQKDVVEKK